MWCRVGVLAGVVCCVMSHDYSEQHHHLNHYEGSGCVDRLGQLIPGVSHEI
jgi:hypothetical protein